MYVNTTMKRACPSVHELLAFDAIARFGSLTAAAETLCVSVSAISKQLANLESFLGHAMLQRNGRGVVLTARGQLYWEKIAAPLRAIQAASFEVRSIEPGAGLLTLASAPTFLTKWLIPRLVEFRRVHPGVTLSFREHLGPNQAMPAGIDAAIRYGAGLWPGVTAEYIAGKEFVLIGARGTLKRPRAASLRQVIANTTLLHHEEAVNAWPQWAGAHGLDDGLVRAGPRFAQYSSLIQAAVSGLGLGLVPRILVADELASGRAELIDREPLTVEQGHYLCYRPDRLSQPSFLVFREWIRAQAARIGVERVTTQTRDALD